MSEHLTELLQQATDGDREAEAQLYELVQEELLRLAKEERRKWNGDITLDTVALISSAFIKLRDYDVSWASRRHFFAVTRTVMKQTLFDEAVRRKALKRGGGATHVDFEDALGINDSEAEAILELRDALDELREADPELAEIVELRYFVGLTNAEIGEMLGMGESTVGRKLRLARGFLGKTMGSSQEILGEDPPV